GGRHSYLRGTRELNGSQQKRTQPVWRRTAHTAAFHGSCLPSLDQKMVFDARLMTCVQTRPMTLESSMCREAPAEARSAPAKAGQYGEPASTMPPIIRTEQLLGSAIGPVMTRARQRLAPIAVPPMLGSPGNAASP